MKGGASRKTNFTEDEYNNKSNRKKLIIALILLIIIIILLLLLLNRKVYTITFDSNGGSLVEEVSVNKNETIPEPEDPTREGYMFGGWYYNDELYDFGAPVTSDMELEASWGIPGAVSGLKLDKKELNLSLGETAKLMVTIEPEDADNKTVIWESSNPDIVSVDLNGNIKALKAGTATITVKTQEGSYTAKTEVVVSDLADIGTIVDKEENTGTTTNTCTVTFVNHDGTVLETKKVEKGTIPTYTKKTPTRRANAQYTYTFAGWNQNVTAIETDTTYTAIYIERINIYKVTFRDEDGKTLSNTQTIEYGGKAEEPTKPTKEGHTFQGWYKGETKYIFTEAIKGNVILTAKWVKNTYSIIFANYDGTVLQTKIVEYGEIPTYTNMEPIKPEDEKYTYKFTGWSPNLTAVEKDTTYKATYISTIKKYEVIFKDEDGTALSNTQTVEYGSKAEEPTTPTKEGYTFQGWYNGETKYTFTEEVKGNVVLTAKWTKNIYTITFVNDDGVVLETKTVEHGIVPEYTKMIPTKAADKVYTYIFKGWDKELVEATKNTTYTATYTATYIDYTIIFVNEDGAELSKNTYHYGDKVQEPETPTKPANAQYTYTFAGWSPSVTKVEKDEIYTATYTETINSYKVTFKDADGTALADTQTIKYGSKATEPTKPTKEGHTFQGWYNGETKYTFTEEVKENVSLLAKWEKIKYTITFINYDGAVLETKQVEYGDIPEYTKMEPTKVSDKIYLYLFNGWDKELVKVTADATYKATFIQKYIDYTITFVNEDGTELSKRTYHYGEIVEQPQIPTKPSDEQYTYTFVGWNPNVSKVEKDTTYTATYKKTLNIYEVTFVDEDGTELSGAQTVKYGGKATEPKDPTKQGHIFQGWYSGETKYTFKEIVRGNVKLIARWIKIKYEITFVNYDGKVLETKKVEYGEIPIYTNETPTKPGNAQYTYTFAGWSPSVTKVEKDAIYTATYTETINSYKVTFKDADGTTLANTQTIKYGSKATEPTKPTKEGHTFQGWYNGETKYTFTEEIKDNVNLMAKWTKNKYTITFANYDGTVLETKTVEYGTKPIYTKATPTRAASNVYTYTFKGWDKELIEATQNETYTATYTEKYIDYTIIFVNEDGTELSKKTYHYGDKVQEPEVPTKAGNEQYTYTFVGWSPSVTEVEKDTTYKATYKATINSYKVTFRDEDGTTLSSAQTVKYGSKAVEPKKPTKKGYTFAGWYNGITKYTFTEVIKGNVNLMAKWTKNKYTITFVNYDGSVLETKIVEYGIIPTYTKDVPIRPGNAQYTYTFTGWSPSITVAEKDTTYKATYLPTTNSYKITFKDADGTILSTQTVKYGNKAVEPKKPTKKGYTFQGWYNGATKYAFTEEVTGNVDLTAKWTKNQYTITFVNYDGSVLETKTVEYGTKPTYTKLTPTRAADNTYTYTFKGWDKQLVEATKSETYTATYTEKYIDYTIIFVNEDGTELSRKTYHYGDKVQEPKAPTKAANAQYTYTFAGWSPSVTTVKGNAIYKATYTGTIRSYTVTFKDVDGKTLASTQTIKYGSKATEPTKPTKKGYTFAGWYNGETKYTFTETIKGNVNLIAKWAKDKYTIIFANYDGTVLETKTVEHGIKPTYTKATPTRKSDNTYTYTFKGWDKEVVEATQDITYNATYTEKYIDYTIIFVNEDGTQLSKKTYHYGDKVQEPGKPTKAANAQYTYTFAGWSPSVTTVKGNATYKATYSSTTRSYTVTFKNDDGKTLSTQIVKYGDKATAPTAPIKEGHTFQGWYNGETKYNFTEVIKGNVTLTARWTKNQYTITFVNYDGSVLETKTVEYGTKPTYTKSTPTRANDAQYIYTFKGWNPSITIAKENTTYTATYTTTIRTYTVTFKNDDGKTLSIQTVKYGDKAIAPTAPTKEGYTFQGWYNGQTKYDFTEVIKGNVTLTAKWTKTIYTIKFVNYNGDVLETKNVEHGATPVYTKATPTRPSDSTLSYKFTGWSPNITVAKENATYTAVYKSFVDVDKKIDNAIAGVKAEEFNVKRTGKTIDVKFTGNYGLLDLASGVANLLSSLSSDPSYKSVVVNYKGKTLNAKNYEMSDALNWIGHLCGKSVPWGLMSATTKDLVGKTVTITITLQDKYTLEDGGKTATYNLKFS